MQIVMAVSCFDPELSCGLTVTMAAGPLTMRLEGLLYPILHPPSCQWCSLLLGDPSASFAGFHSLLPYGSLLIFASGLNPIQLLRFLAAFAPVILPVVQPIWEAQACRCWLVQNLPEP
jgi:hypothetical protein